MTKQRENYIDAEELLGEIKKSIAARACTERLGALLLTLHDHVAGMPRFKSSPPEDKEEMKSFSILRILKSGFRSFAEDADARKAFNYLTTAAVNNMTKWRIGERAKRLKLAELKASLLERFGKPGFVDL